MSEKPVPPEGTGPVDFVSVDSVAEYLVDECLQFFGGYGYMWEYPITRAYADARVQRIYGGTNEIMKEVITRSMGLGGK